MQKVLVTGFDPFGGESVNPALEAVTLLAGRTLNGVEVVTKELPTVFHKSIKVLKAVMQEVQPDIVICVGQAGGRHDITVERVAINVDDASIPDNDGNQPIDCSIIDNAPTAYLSSLPIKLIVDNLCAAGIPASVSQTAGTFVCNHIFYALCHLIATEFSGVRGGFIHIPYLPEQATQHRGAPSMNVENIVRSLAIAIQTAVSSKQAMVTTGGRIS